MKTNAVVRIVVYSLVIIILLGILLAGIGVNVFSVNHMISGDPDVEVHTLDMNGSVSANAVNNISIEWVAGSVTIKPEDTDKISFSESDVEDEKMKMVWKLDGSTLKLQYCKESIKFPSFGINFTGNLSKDLLITVPRDWACDTLRIDCASATVNAQDLTIREVDFDGASGTCSFENCHVDELDLDTASGDVVFSGTLNALDCDAASANCEITVSNVPQRFDIDTASGDLELTLPDGCGFTCGLDTMSGRFSSDFETTTNNGHHVHGDGSCRINVSAMSGDVTIKKHSGISAVITDGTHHDEHH